MQPRNSVPGVICFRCLYKSPRADSHGDDLCISAAGGTWSSFKLHVRTGKGSSLYPNINRTDTSKIPPYKAASMAQTPAQFTKFPGLPAEIQCLVLEKYYEDPRVVSLSNVQDPLTSEFTCRYEFSPWMYAPLSVNHLFNAEAKRAVLKSKAGTYLHKWVGEEQYSAWFNDAITTLDVGVYGSFEPKIAVQFKRRFKNLTRIINVDDATLGPWETVPHQVLGFASTRCCLLDVLERKANQFLAYGFRLLVGDQSFHTPSGALGNDVTLSMEVAWPADKWASTPLSPNPLELLPRLVGQFLFLQFELIETTCALKDLSVVDVDEETDWTAEEVVKMIQDAEEESRASEQAETSD